MSGVAVSVCLSAVICIALAAPLRTVRQSVIVSEQTGRFLTLGGDGTVTANGDRGASESQLVVHYLDSDKIQIQSDPNINSHKNYLIFDGEKFVAGPADKDDGIFEVVVQADEYSVALRYTGLSGDNNDCYIGFEGPESQPTCYPSADFTYTSFIIVH